MNYFNIYQNIIKLAQTRGIAKRSKRNKLSGFEKHHIIPKCAGGTDHPDNLVFLTAREHFICHMLLVKFCKPEHLKSLQYALGMMRSRGHIVSSHSYDFARKQYLLAHVKNRTGSKHSEETKAKMSFSHTGKKKSKEHCSNLRLSQLGKHLSDAHKQKLSNATKGRKINYQLTEKQLMPKPIVVCPHCNKSGGKPAMKRFHFDKCKFKL